MSSYWYREGSASVADGATAVTGSGTLWLKAGVSAGDMIAFESAPTRWYEVQSAAGETALTLATSAQGAHSGAYVIIRLSFLSTSNAKLAAQLALVLANWQQREDQFRAWHGGVIDGGPEGDGRYPLSDADGNEYLVPCPAWFARASELAGTLDAEIQRAEDAADTATGAATTATTQAGIATGAADTATTKASEATAAATATAADATATAADRTQTGLDRTAAEAAASAAADDALATAADRVATGEDRTATAADRVATGEDRTATAADALATAADRAQTGLDRTAAEAAAAATAADALATAADREQTGLDRAATGADALATAADRIQTGLDRAAAEQAAQDAQDAADAATGDVINDGAVGTATTWSSAMISAEANKLLQLIVAGALGNYVPGWVGSITYNEDRDPTQVVYVRGSEMVGVVLGYADGDLATISVAYSSDSGETWASLGAGTVQYDAATGDITGVV